MSTLAIIGAVAMIVISILIIVVVSLQEGKGDGITALPCRKAVFTRKRMWSEFSRPASALSSMTAMTVLPMPSFPS